MSWHANAPVPDGISFGMRDGVFNRRVGNVPFLSFHDGRHGNAGRLDDVDDVDADAWLHVDSVSGYVFADVAGHDGGDDAAVGPANATEPSAILRAF